MYGLGFISERKFYHGFISLVQHESPIGLNSYRTLEIPALVSAPRPGRACLCVLRARLSVSLECSSLINISGCVYARLCLCFHSWLLGRALSRD